MVLAGLYGVARICGCCTCHIQSAQALHLHLGPKSNNECQVKSSSMRPHFSTGYALDAGVMTTKYWYRQQTMRWASATIDEWPINKTCLVCETDRYTVGVSGQVSVLAANTPIL